MNVSRSCQRKLAPLTVTLIVVLGLTGKLVASGPHLTCHTEETPTHACTVCAQMWLSPAAPAPVLDSPPLPVLSAETVAPDVDAPVAVVVVPVGRAPPLSAS